jgi:hypothetical protein
MMVPGACCVFVLCFLILCVLCCQFLWIVHFWLLLRYSPKSRKTNNATMLEQFQNLEKQIIPHCWNSSKINRNIVETVNTINTHIYNHSLLFQKSGIICFSRFWNCSNSVVLFVFLDFWTVSTVLYYLFF